MYFFEKLEGMLNSARKSIVFPEGENPKVIAVAKRLSKKKFVKNVFLLGKKEIIAELLKKDESLEIAHRDKCIAFEMSSHQCDMLGALWDEKSQISQSTAQTWSKESFVQDKLIQGGWLVSKGFADVCIAGLDHTTSQVIKASLTTVGMESKNGRISGAFLMWNPESKKTYIFSDCGVNINPDPRGLAQIAANAVTLHRKLFFRDLQGIPKDAGNSFDSTAPEEAKVAFLSFSTKGSAQHAMQEKVSQGFEIFKQTLPEVCCDGELQLDAAIVPEIAAKKAPDSPLKGKANILVFPDLNSGNIAYKMAQRMAGYTAMGPLLLGLSKPYADLSRGSTKDDIYGVTLINMLLN